MANSERFEVTLSPEEMQQLEEAAAAAEVKTTGMVPGGDFCPAYRVLKPFLPVIKKMARLIPRYGERIVRAIEAFEIAADAFCAITPAGAAGR